MPEYVLYLVDVLCKSVGVPLAGVHVGGAGALSLDPAEVVPATLLSEADRGRLSDGDLAWLQLHGPSQKEKRSIDDWHSFLFNVRREHAQLCASVPVLADPRDMWVGFPGGRGCCSPEWGKSLVETCGLVACWVGWVLTGDLSGTKTAAVGPTGHSEEKRHRVEMLGQVCPGALPITEKTVVKSCFSVSIPLAESYKNCFSRFIIGTWSHRTTAHLSRAGSSMLGRWLISCWSTGRLGLMNCPRVVGEGLWSYRRFFKKRIKNINIGFFHLI